MLSLPEIKVLIDAELELTYSGFKVSATEIDPMFGELMAEMETFIVRGGKRLRPYLAYLSYVGCGGKDEKSFLSVAVGLEIFHNFLLIHDDVIDRDTVRYGGPNIIGRYQERLKSLSDSEDKQHFSEMAAVLAGDSASSMARLLFYEAPFSAEARLKALQCFDEALFAVAGGEFVDSLAAPLGFTSLSKEQIISVYIHKTALYSFGLPLQVGAALAGSTDDTFIALKALSLPIGVAYQMQDDYLGLFGSEEETGKPVLSDVREGKQTYLYALMSELTDPQQKERLSRLYGMKDAGVDEVEEIKRICIECGASGKVEELMRSYVSEAVEMISAVPLKEEVRDALRQLITMCLNRSA
jgi:geranylgeranyl diphosphate synthase type II